MTAVRKPQPVAQALPFLVQQVSTHPNGIRQVPGAAPIATTSAVMSIE
ncbi:hypothetical protein [Hymenobacter guriensis]|uniref:Uncharacterized protein n=1 Tax=Hymenobacter guriensis TaxID=2793065 RepID=A0ABS0KZL7_9BACT|nr:hypothetical protein [Hymenobacter guriensis]MBG8553312.1 hypothetical protein [Hymenobacter guriensis]